MLSNNLSVNNNLPACSVLKLPSAYSGGKSSPGMGIVPSPAYFYNQFHSDETVTWLVHDRSMPKIDSLLVSASWCVIILGYCIIFSELSKVAELVHFHCRPFFRCTLDIIFCKLTLVRVWAYRTPDSRLYTSDDVMVRNSKFHSLFGGRYLRLVTAVLRRMNFSVLAVSSAERALPTSFSSSEASFSLDANIGSSYTYNGHFSKFEFDFWRENFRKGFRKLWEISDLLELFLCTEDTGVYVIDHSVQLHQIVLYGCSWQNNTSGCRHQFDSLWCFDSGIFQSVSFITNDQI